VDGEGGVRGFPLLHTMKEDVFEEQQTQEIHFWEVCLSFLENCVSADTLEGIFDIKI